MRLAQATAMLLAVGAVGACAPQAPVEQVQLFSQAFQNVQTASQPLFDDLAAAERELGRRIAEDDARQQLEPGELPPEAPSVVLAPAVEGPVSGPAGAGADVGADQEAEQPATTAQASPHTSSQIAVAACVEGAPGWQPTFADGPDGQPIGYVDAFCLEDAAYYAAVGDPPATRSFRRGIDVLGQYSEVLLTLATGRNIDEAKARLEIIASAVTGASALVPAAVPAAGLIGPVFQGLAPIVEEAAKAQNFTEMKRLVTEASPSFNRLIAALQASSPWIFKTLIRKSERKVPIETAGNPDLARSVVGTIEGYRMAVSDFVLLLDEMGKTHADIVAALSQREADPLSLAQLANRAERMNAQATALREAFVLIRRGAP